MSPPPRKTTQTRARAPAFARAFQPSLAGRGGVVAPEVAPLPAGRARALLPQARLRGELSGLSRPRGCGELARLETGAGGRLRRGCSFNRRSVPPSRAHFHAKSLTSEHLLLLNAFLARRGESCGAGRAHFEERGPGRRSRAPEAPAQPRGALPRTRRRERVAGRSASALVTGRNAFAAGLIAPGPPQVPAVTLGGANFASCYPAPARSRAGKVSGVVRRAARRHLEPRCGRLRGAPAGSPGDAAGARGSVTPRAGTWRRARPRAGEGRVCPRDPDARPACGTRPWRMREQPPRGRRQSPSPSRSPRRAPACLRRSPGSGPT